MTEGMMNPEQDTETAIYEDYFGFDETVRHYLPDRRQFFEIKKMNEGDKAKFQKDTRKDVVVGRTGEARMSADPAAERHALIKAAVCNWSLYRGGQPQPFDQSMLHLWLQKANPKVVEDLELAIRKANPWLLGEMTVAEIDREITNLQEMRKVAEEREAGEGVSSSR